MWKTSRMRNLVQAIFSLVVIYIGVKFILFVNSYTNYGQAALERPAGVEGFLPISALVSLKVWLGTGKFDSIHPAGLVILLSVLLISLLFKKAFCAWICPIGTLSEGLARLGRFFFGRNFKLPAFLDYPLRGLKYILLLFFLSTVLLFMSTAQAASFLASPYNMIADVKMLQFFQSLSGTSLLIVGLLVILSVLFENFWCRYLCPYGALLGLVSLLSPWKITRSREACTGCGACTRACPNRIRVADSSRIWSPECSGCQSCINACPTSGALRFNLPASKLAVSPKTTAVMIVSLWIVLVLLAKFTGHWQTALTPEMYRTLIPHAADFSH